MAVIIRFTDTVDIPIGGACKIEIDDQKLSASILGYVPSDIILIAAPPPQTKKSTVTEGAKIVVSFLTEGKPYGFESTISKIYADPMPIWALPFPDRFQSLSVRKSERINTFIPAVVRKDDGAEFKGTLLNMSEGGGRVAVEKGDFGLDEKVTFSITFPEGKKAEDLPCDIRHIEENKDIVSIGLRLRVLDKNAPGYKEFEAYYQLISGNFSIPTSVHSIYPI